MKRLWVCLTMGAGVLATPAVAQFDALTQQAIDRAIPLLTDGTIAESQRAREDLIAPIRNPSLTVADRQSYARTLLPAIRELAESDEAHKKLSAIKLAAALGTEDTIGFVRDAMNADVEAHKLFAYARLRELFASLERQTPAMSSTTATALIADLAADAANATDAVLLDAQVRALGAAATVPGTNFTAGRRAAWLALAGTMSDRIRAADAALIDDRLVLVHLRAGTRLRDALISVDRSGMSREEAIAAIEYGGDLIKFVDDQLNADALPDSTEGRKPAVQLVAVAEAMISLGAAAVGDASGQTVRIPDQGLARLLEAGNARDFRRRAVELIGGSGPLTRSPIGLPSNRFIGG